MSFTTFSRSLGAHGFVRSLGVLMFGGALAVPTSAWATNGKRPRTPSTFLGEHCHVAVDRSRDPVFTLEYGLPVEDDDLGMDELPDSRTFQFFALCRDPPPDAPLPNWITLADAERALAAGNIEELPAPEDVLESAPAWQRPGHDGLEGSCVHALNPAEERIPIVCESGDRVVAWDTTNVPVGDYVIRGYTFEPPVNLWSERLGVVSVSDGEDSPAAVAVMSPARDADAFVSPGYRVVGCAAGVGQVTLAWAKGTGPAFDQEDAWTPFETFAAAGDFDVRFLPPEEAIYQAIFFRATLVEDSGRSVVSHSRHPLVVRPGCGPSDEPTSSVGPDICTSVPPDPLTQEDPECDDSGEADDGTGTDAPGADDDGSSGCACRAATGQSTSMWGLMVILGSRARRRRLCQSPRH